MSLRICAVWSDSSLIACAFYSCMAAFIQRGLHENPCHTGWTYRLICLCWSHRSYCRFICLCWSHRPYCRFCRALAYKRKGHNTNLKINIFLISFWKIRKYSQTAITSLGLCKFFLDIGSSNHWGLIITPGQKAKRYNLGMSLRAVWWLYIECTH